MAAGPASVTSLLDQKHKAYHAFNDIIPVPKILVTSDAIKVISWKTSIVWARPSWSLFTGWLFMNTLTPMVAATPTSKEAGL